MTYKPSTPEERKRFLKPIYGFLFSAQWLIGFVASFAIFWGWPLAAGFIAYFAILAATLDAGKRSLGSYKEVFSSSATKLPANQKIMLAGAIVATLVNSYAVLFLIKSA